MENLITEKSKTLVGRIQRLSDDEEYYAGCLNLILSAAQNDIKGIDQEIKNGLDISHFNITLQISAIHAAIESFSDEAMHYLIKLGALNSTDPGDESPLLLALRVGNLTAYKELENHEFYKGDPKKTWLNIAVASGSIPLAEHLLNGGHQIDMNTLGSALSITDGSVMEMAEFLIHKGAKVNSNLNADNSDLRKAIYARNEEFVKLLLKNGANPNDVNGGQHILNHAIHWNDFGCAKLLIDAGASIPLAEYNTKPLLSMAARHGNDDMVRILVGHGSDLNKIFDEETPLFIAISRKKYKTAETLLGLGADVNAGALENMYPIHFAAENSLTVTKLLVKYGADINLMGVTFTPLITAIMQDKENIAEYLIKAGADIEKRDTFYNTPLLNAVLFNQPKVVEILVNAGADLMAKHATGQTPLEIAAGKDKIKAIIENKMLNNSLDSSDDINLEAEPVIKRRLRI